MGKRCPKCNRVLPLLSFNWKVKGIKRSIYCKDCSRKYIREHYWKNRQYYLDKVHKRNIKVRKQCYDYLGKYLSAHKCVDCGENDIVVLEFDHRSRDDKKMEISRIIKSRGTLIRLIEEVSKCDVRCANCHRRKTSKESHSWKLKFAPVA